MPSPTTSPAERPARGVATVHGPLVAWIKRAAVLVLALSPFLKGFLIAPCVLGALLYGHLGQLKRRGQFTADPEGLRVNGQLLVPRATFSFAFPIDRRDGDPLICFVRGGEVVAEVAIEDAPSRDRLLEGLGFGAAAGPFRCEGALSPELRSAAAVVGAVLSGFAFSISVRHESLGGMVVMAILLLLSGSLVLRRDVRVGRDGVWVAAPFRRHWVSFAELRGVSRAGLWLRLHTTRGDVDVGSPLLWPSSRAAAAREGLAAAIRRAATRFERAPRATTALDACPRGAPISTREGSFRSPAVSGEDLLRIVEDPRSSGEARVRAAAGLLGASPSDEQRAQIRAAAEESASPAVQRALQLALAAEDEAGLEHAVASVGWVERARRSR